MILFERCEYQEIQNEVEQYYVGKDILIDSFVEEHIKDSNYYIIKKHEEVIGFASIFKGYLISMFHIQDQYTKYAQAAFLELKHLEEVREAFAPTGDEQLVSVCMDSFKMVEIQAYFTKDVYSKGSGDIQLRLASLEDKHIVETYHDGFFENVEKCIVSNSIYIAYQDQEVVGFGNYELGWIRKDYVSIGMFTRPEYRRKGIGTKILCGLKEMGRQEGRCVVAGCWYYNHNSIKTQFACGNACSSRLLKFHF